MKRSIRRRDFLSGIGAGAVLAPFVPFLHREAEAAGGTAPRRLLVLFTGDGSVPSEFWPTGGETDFAFKPGSITEPLAAFKSKMIYPRNVKRARNGPGGHESAHVCLWTCSSRNSGGTFGGYAKNPSFDQVIAKALPQETAFPSLEFGVQHDGPGANSRILSVMLYAGSDQPIQPESNPYRMFDRLMLGSGSSPTGIRPEDLERVKVRRQSVLDLVREELKALGSKVDKDDRVKIDQHVEGLSGIEKRLNRPINPAMGSGCGATPPKMGIDLVANDSFPELLAIQNGLAVAALACDRTRVASLQWSRAFSQVRHTWVGVNTEHHTLSHKTTANDTKMKATIDRWYMERMAELFAKMDGIQEADGTLLDNTLAIYANELCEGAPHSASPAITFIAGSCGRKLKTGRLLDLGAYDFSQLLTTAAHAMGATSVNKIGDLQREGDIPTLYA